jgi:cytochrome P450
MATATVTPARPYGLSVLPKLAADPPGFFLETLNKRGNLVEINLGSAKLLLVHHPDYVRHVMQDHARNYGKGSMWVAIRRMVGNGLLGSEGDIWLRQRRLMQPACHRQRLGGLATSMTTTIAETLDSWTELAKQGQTVEVIRAQADLTMQLIVRTMFGTSLDPQEMREIGEAFGTALKLMNTRMWTSFLPINIPLPGDAKFRDSVATVDRYLYRLIAERRKHPGQANDLLEMLLEIRDEETGEGMTDQQVRDEVFTVFLAGHETTASIMAWVWYVLNQYPDIERKLHAELDRVLAGRLPSMATLHKLTYTKMLIEETMRFYPASWMIPRSVEADDVIGGLPVKKGTTVLISPYVVHRHPDFWENPETFDPERFHPDKVVPRSAFIPFGSGPRLCIGNSFAMMEMQLILAMTAQAFRLRLLPSITNVKTTTMPTLRPNKALQMTLETRTKPVTSATWLIATETGEYAIVPPEDSTTGERG